VPRGWLELYNEEDHDRRTYLPSDDIRAIISGKLGWTRFAAVRVTELKEKVQSVELGLGRRLILRWMLNRT
jgi:hypothetical protein